MARMTRAWALASELGAQPGGARELVTVVEDVAVAANGRCHSSAALRHTRSLTATVP